MSDQEGERVVENGQEGPVNGAIEALNAKIAGLFDKERSLLEIFRRNWINPLHMSQEQRKLLLNKRNEIFGFLILLMEKYNVSNNQVFSTVALLLDIVMYSRLADDQLKNSIHLPLVIFTIACKFHLTVFPLMQDLVHCELYIHYHSIPNFMRDSLTALTQPSLVMKEVEVLGVVGFNIHLVDYDTFLMEVISMAPAEWKEKYGDLLDSFVSYVVSRVSLCHVRPSMVVAVSLDAVAWYCMRPEHTHTVFSLDFIPPAFAEFAVNKRDMVENFRQWFRNFGAQAGARL